MIGTPGFNPHAPGPIGDTTPSVINGTSANFTGSTLQGTFGYDNSHHIDVGFLQADGVSIINTVGGDLRINNGGTVIVVIGATALQVLKPISCSGPVGTFTGTVANLNSFYPAASYTGSLAFVTDGSTTVILGLGLTVTGGGGNFVPVYSNGSNWIVG